MFTTLNCWVGLIIIIITIRIYIAPFPKIELKGALHEMYIKNKIRHYTFIFD